MTPSRHLQSISFKTHLPHAESFVKIDDHRRGLDIDNDVQAQGAAERQNLRSG